MINEDGAYVEDIAAQEKPKEKKSTKAGTGKEEGKQKKLRLWICRYVYHIMELKHLHVVACG